MRISDWSSDVCSSDLHMPARRTVARRNVLAGGKARRTVDGDALVVPQDVQASQLQVAGEADRLMVDAFHQAAVAGDHPGAMIDQVVPDHLVRSEEGRVGKEGGRTCRCGWAPDHEKTNKKNT